MADDKNRLPQNASGPWYVDANCIDCDLCRETAPTIFRRDDENGNSVVYHQPETEAEYQLAVEARSGCPVEAIGNDGPPLHPTPAEAAKASDSPASNGPTPPDE